MNNTTQLNNMSFAVYGMGLTGKSVIKFLRKKKVKKYYIWDDIIFKKNLKKKYFFLNNLDIVDYIIISPGINISNSIFKKKLFKNRKKIITDLDLFYAANKVKKSIVVTGTNGKSTTCALINHILKKNKFKTCLVGNIGVPILNNKFDNKKTYIIEASSYQLAHSKFIKPKYALILNITKDHLDWHGTKKNYLESKFKIFRYQNKNQIAILNDYKLKRLYKKRKYQGKLKFLNSNISKNEITNQYLQLEMNFKNIEFAYTISKYFRIKKDKFLRSLQSFKGLPHRQEIFLKRKSNIFINDSKATTFESTKSALHNYDNIIWILGGLPKLNDKIEISKFKDKIIKTYIIGKYPKFFEKQLKNKVKYTAQKQLITVIKNIFKELKNLNNTNILFSPASASFDQFKNFVDRGNYFKKIVKHYDKKYF